MSVARTLTVQVDLPWSIQNEAPPDPAAVGLELRLLWLIEQVRVHRLGVGKAAELAGVPRAAFMRTLGEHGVPVIDYPADELDREIVHLGLG